MASQRKLGFWETMCEIAHDGFNGTGMVLQVARVHGALAEDHLRTALVALQRRHPLLRSRLEPSAAGSSIRVDEEPGPAPLRVLSRAGGPRGSSSLKTSCAAGSSPARLTRSGSSGSATTAGIAPIS